MSQDSEAQVAIPTRLFLQEAEHDDVHDESGPALTGRSIAANRKPDHRAGSKAKRGRQGWQEGGL